MDRRTAEEITAACLLILSGARPSGWFLHRKTGKEYDVRPFMHVDWSERNADKLGVSDKAATDWTKDDKSFLELFKNWMRVVQSGSNLSFMVSGPLKKRDLHSMQDFAATNRAGDVTVDIRFQGRGVYQIPWKEFIGVDGLGGLRAYKS